ncbi:MAG: DUF2950 domain-containing protein [Roseovarius sp.]|nr:DUF2950 domain-containing protein [Roseovarius sp.]
MFNRQRFAILALLASTGIASAEPAPFESPGIVYESDLGADTLTRAQDIVVFIPDDLWAPVQPDQ